jgi:hypothetical protein
MVVRAGYRKFPFPYLYDGDEQAAANKFGPRATPHIFIFDRQRKLRFEGRIDDNLRAARVKTHEARDAIEALLAGRPVPVEHTSAVPLHRSCAQGRRLGRKEIARKFA